MNSVLDDLDYINKIDSKEMFQEIIDFPNSARKTLDEIDRLVFSIKGEEYNSLLIAGMGGSAVGGLLLRDWLLDTLDIPIVVNRSYHLPAWVNKNTLIYAVSYSGNTEETLSQYEEAVRIGCNIVCFCSGGILEEKAEENNHLLIKFPKGHQPRAAIPFQFYNLAGVTRKIGLISETKWGEIEESIKLVDEHCNTMRPERSLKENSIKKIALELKGYIPFIYGPYLFQSVAYRYSTQFNENSKSPAATNFYPEAFHNSVMAREGDELLLDRICMVIVNDSKSDERLKKKIDISVDLMKKTFGKAVSIESKGDSNLARIMSALIQGDFLSAYLAILYGVDPSTTDSINILKASVED